MLRRSALRLGESVVAKPVAPGERPGEVKVGVSDWVQTFVNPFYHFERLSYIEEEVDATKTRKWIIMSIVLAYPVYWILFKLWEVPRAPAKVNGKYPEVCWNDEKAGVKN